MARVRLTKRHAAVDKTPYSGDIGNEGRQDPEYGKYDNYVELPGWETPDMNHEWKNDARNEMHIPVMRSASIARIRKAASKAVRLAVLLLGDKVEEKVIEAQARDFLRLSEECLENSLKRYQMTEKLYAEEEEVEDKKKAEGEIDEEKVEEAKKAEGDEEVEDKKKAEGDEEVEDKKKAEGDEEVEDKKKAEGEIDEEKVEEAKKAEEDEEEACVKAGEMDIEMESMEDEDVVMSEEDEEILSKLFAEEDMEEEKKAEEDEEKEVKKASKKGIQKLGGQVKVASTDSENLCDLWNSAPDVNDIFK